MDAFRTDSVMRSWILNLAVVLGLCLAAGPAYARMGLIVGEPFGSFGTMMPQGHAGIYLSNLCVETAVRLRPCGPGELGAVISRYHDLRHPARDWLAFPLPVFLYGTEDLTKVPPFMTAKLESALREQYREQHLLDFVPDRLDRHGLQHPPPYGDWEEGIGAAFDRRLLVYSFDTTPAQDATMLAWLNDGENHRSYTLTRHNCADFAADLLRMALPPTTIHRNVPADFDMTTPKQLAREVDSYGRAHPELHFQAYEIPQLPGALRRSRPLRGAAESLLTTKRYLVTLLAIQPEIIVADLVIYEKRGKWTPGRDAIALRPEDWATQNLADDPALSPATVSGLASSEYLPYSSRSDVATGRRAK
jgi:hypothetical protein